MKNLRRTAAAVSCLAAGLLLHFPAFAEEFTEEDRRIFGIFPVWAFLLLLAGILMCTIILIIEIVKRKKK